MPPHETSREDMINVVQLAVEQDRQQRDHGARDNGRDRAFLPPPSLPMNVAREFIDDKCVFEDGTTPTLRYWRGGWWLWRSSYWEEVGVAEMRSALYEYTEHAVYMEGKSLKPWAPNRKRIGDLVEALASVCILPSTVDQPCWLDDRITGSIVATTNGLLDIERGQLYAHTPLFFNQASVPFNYDPNAEHSKWTAFLDKLWPDDPAAIDVLGEWFGYVVSGRLDLHKILLMVGPTRGGKGVIARILTALVGRQNTCGPTLNQLGGEFGLAPFIGKPLAVISDARFVGKNGNVVVERLLSISGEDTLTVNRKYREQWTGKLPTRLHVISNELPRLGDASSAVIGRIVLLVLSNSWLGREDHELEGALREELAGILNWSLEGLRRLTVRNRNAFTRTASSDEAIVTMHDLASPVAAFAREMCEQGADYEVDRDDLYLAYKQWSDINGHPKSAKHVFGRDLKAAFPSIKTRRPWGGGKDRSRVYAGIRLRSREEEDWQRGRNIENSHGLPGRPDEDGDSPSSPNEFSMFPARDQPAALGRCAQCNGIATDAPLVIGDGYPPAGIHLHEQCRRFWLRRHRVTRERFVRVGPASPGSYCIACRTPDGDVDLWRDARVIGSKTEPLHQACAAGWFRRLNGGDPDA
jgi:putative DNA primase/helicase